MTKNLLLKLLKKNGRVLEYASNDLQNNMKLIMMALKEIYFLNYKTFKLYGNKFKYNILYGIILPIQKWNNVLNFF